MSNKTFITTKGHLEWDEKLQQYIAVSDEGYEYDGPLALAGGTPTRATGDWAFYNDGTEAGAVIIGSINADPSLDTNTIYHFRQVIAETAGNTWADADIQLQYRHVEGTNVWTDVNATSDVVRCTGGASGLINDGDTTDRIPGPNTWQDGHAGQDDDNGFASDGTRFADEYANVVYAFFIVEEDITDGDTIDLRIVDTTGGAWDSENPALPTMTVAIDADSATSIARWLLSEASSGTTPTECADDTGNVNTLTIDYGTSNLEWINVTAGNGLQSLSNDHDAIAELANISANGNIGSSLEGAHSCSLVIRGDFLSGLTLAGRLFHIGTSAGGGDIAIVNALAPERLIVRFDAEVTNYANDYAETFPSGIQTIIAVIDTSEALAADRCKFYIDNVLQTPTASTIVRFSKIYPDQTDRSVCLFNRPDNLRGAEAKLFYAELFTGKLSDTERALAHTNLTNNNDTDWNTDTQTINDTSFISATSATFLPEFTGTLTIPDIQLISATSQTFIPDFTGTLTIQDVDFIPVASQTFTTDVTSTLTIQDIDFVSATSQTFLIDVASTITIQDIGFIGSTSQTFLTTVTSSLTIQDVGFISSTSQTFLTDVSSTITIQDIGFIASTAQTFIPDLTALVANQIDLGTIISGNATYTPEVILWKTIVDVGFIASTSQTFTPELSGSLVIPDVDFISSTSQTFVPSFTGTFTIPDVDFISSTNQLFLIDLSSESTIQLGYIVSGNELFEPSRTTSVTIDNNYIASSNAVYDVTISGSISVDIDYIASTANLFDMSISSTYTVQVDYLDSTSTIYELGIDSRLTIDIGFISSTTQIHEPVVIFERIEVDIIEFNLNINLSVDKTLYIAKLPVFISYINTESSNSLNINTKSEHQVEL